MTRPISARIKVALLSQLELERCNGIKTNWLINEAITMYLEALDAVREDYIKTGSPGMNYQKAQLRWFNRIVYTTMQLI